MLLRSENESVFMRTPDVTTKVTSLGFEFMSIIKKMAGINRKWTILWRHFSSMFHSRSTNSFFSYDIFPFRAYIKYNDVSPSNLEEGLMNVTRRHFFGTATGAGLFAIVPARVLFGAEAPSNQLTRAIIGCGGIAHSENHLPFKGSRLVALCDVDAKHLSSFAGGAEGEWGA